ncbi:hypothetical protein PI125_g21558 [Phytophthora idaei]|nr:hypothetical protein PI125_g21558 [Phytophthora idaei]KAG3131551.1 hypothetical protein PI126_g20006 [Phytophthora idaei]
MAQGQTSDFVFTAASAMANSEWIVDSGASLYITSVLDKFVPRRDPMTPVRITIGNGTKIDEVATGTVGLKLMGGASVTLSDVLYIPEVGGSLISVSKPAEKDVAARSSKGMCVFSYGNAAHRGQALWSRLQAEDSGGGGHVATARKKPWTVVHARLGHIPYKRYEQLLSAAEGVLRVTNGVHSNDVCPGCDMGKDEGR